MLYLAPLQGLTDLPYRIAFAKCFGNVVDYAVSPFVSLTHGDLNSNFKKLKDVLPDANKDAIPLIPQILGNNAEHFLALADTLWDMGYGEINWNLGCPVKRVSNKKRGSGLLPYPDLIDAFLETVFAKVKQDISLKIRLGYSNEDEVFSLLPVFEKYPLKSITIHPRIGVQMYEGDLHIETFERCIPHIRCDLIFNGDIRMVKDIRHIRSSYPEVKGVMIGRGLLINPLLAGDAKGVAYDNPKAKLQEFAVLLQEQLLLHKSERAALNKMKEFWSYLAQNFNDSECVFGKIQIVDDLHTLEQIAKACFNTEVLRDEKL